MHRPIVGRHACARPDCAAAAAAAAASPPAAVAEQGSGLSWLFPFQDGAPPIGWHDATAYLVLPLLLVASQYVSQKIVSPQSNDPQQQQTQAILGFIPFMIGEPPGQAALLAHAPRRCIVCGLRRPAARVCCCRGVVPPLPPAPARA